MVAHACVTARVRFSPALGLRSCSQDPDASLSPRVSGLARVARQDRRVGGFPAAAPERAARGVFQAERQSGRVHRSCGVSWRTVGEPVRVRAHSMTERFLILVDRHNRQCLARWEKVTQSGP